MLWKQDAHIKGICCPLAVSHVYSTVYLWSSLIFAHHVKTVTGSVDTFRKLKKNRPLSSQSNHNSVQAESEMLAVCQVLNYTKRPLALILAEPNEKSKIFEMANPSASLAKTALFMHSGEQGVSVDVSSPTVSQACTLNYSTKAEEGKSMNVGVQPWTGAISVIRQPHASLCFHKVL